MIPRSAISANPFFAQKAQAGATAEGNARISIVLEKCMQKLSCYGLTQHPL